MHRLRCGVIYTNDFAGYLSRLVPPTQPDHILALDYVRAATGPNTGKEWWRIEWLPVRSVAENCVFKIGDVPVCLSKQSQRGLKNRCLDWRDGEVRIRS